MAKCVKCGNYMINQFWGTPDNKHSLCSECAFKKDGKRFRW